MTSLTTDSNNGASYKPGVPKKYRTHSEEVKKAAVERVEKGEATWAIAQDLGAHDAQIRDWCKRAGVIAPPPVHDEAFINAAVARVKQGESLTAVTLSVGIGRERLKKWLIGTSTAKTKRDAGTTLKTFKRIPKAKPGKRRVFDDAYKAAAVAQVKKSALSVTQVATSLKLTPSVLQRWVRESRTPTLPRHEKALIKKTVAVVMGKPAFTELPSGRRAFTEAAKREAVARWTAGESHRVLCEELKIGTGALSAWRKELERKDFQQERTKRKYEKRTGVPGPAGAMPMASALAVRDAITYLRHVKTDMYMLLQTGVIKEFEEYHLNVLAALKRLQSAA